MIGVYVGENYLVTQSYKEDGIFYICFLIALLLFVLKDNIGKYILSIWLFIWFIAQFLNHEWFTIFGNGEAKIRYFNNSIHWFDSSTRYIPDVYHTILHLLLVMACVVTIRYCLSKKDQKRKKLMKNLNEKIKRKK
jgi:hypothetical protein